MSKHISEIYPCLQGEGSLAGTPSILIRTLGCNLRCGWCDTPYTSWQLEKGNFSVSDIQEFLDRNPRIGDVIITGGEPCISPDIEDIINLSKDNNKRITLETNATRLLPDKLMEKIDLVSLSPKLSNSVPATDEKWKSRHDNERINIPVIRQWIQSVRSFQLKFVVNHPDDMQEIRQIADETGIDNKYIYLMPQGTTQQQLKEKRLWLADICISEGYHYCERLHIVIYGDKRGV